MRGERGRGGEAERGREGEREGGRERERGREGKREGVRERAREREVGRDRGRKEGGWGDKCLACAFDTVGPQVVARGVGEGGEVRVAWESRRCS